MSSVKDMHLREARASPGALVPMPRGELAAPEAQTFRHLEALCGHPLQAVQHGRLRVGYDARQEGPDRRHLHRLVARSTSQLLSSDSIADVVRPDFPEIVAGLLRGESVPIDLGQLAGVGFGL